MQPATLAKALMPTYPGKVELPWPTKTRVLCQQTTPSAEFELWHKSIDSEATNADAKKNQQYSGFPCSPLPQY